MSLFFARSRSIDSTLPDSPKSYGMQWTKRPLNAYWLMMLVALFLVCTANITFFSKVNEIYPWLEHGGFIVALGCVLVGVMLLVIVLFGYRYTLKFVLILLCLIAAVTAYFTDTYGTVYDTTMLQNALQTDKAEGSDLMNFAFALRFVLLGLLPSWLIFRQPVYFPAFRRSLGQRIGVWLVSLALIGIPLALYGKGFASFFREHKPIRFYTNPLTPIYAVGKLASIEYKKATISKTITMYAKDAVQTTSAAQRPPKLIVMVVGETARADHIGQNGYARDTFAQLRRLSGVTNFSQVTSCGTSTAYSVPCMFSYLGEKNYDVDRAPYQENVIDTLHRLKVQVIWRDNNSDSKGVMTRLPASQYADYKQPSASNVCNSNPYGECRDTNMLVGLDDYVQQHAGQDILIVLHQMGNHGPAYYKRYDAKFEQFTPVCRTNDLAKCDPQAVKNAYDNALLATDDFLAQIIQWLNRYDKHKQVALLYVSDHGESLGENGVYLHGMPNAFAPDAQKHVAAIFWSGQHSGIQAVDGAKPLNHDAITPTLLDLFDIKTQATVNKPRFIHTVQPVNSSTVAQ